MATIAKGSSGKMLADNAEYGVELTVVDFKEFDRRKSPRMSNYATFLKSLEPVSIEIEFIV